jgi:hypothetical protein
MCFRYCASVNLLKCMYVTENKTVHTFKRMTFSQNMSLYCKKKIKSVNDYWLCYKVGNYHVKFEVLMATKSCSSQL